MATITNDIIKPAQRLTPPKNWGPPTAPVPAAPLVPQPPSTTAGDLLDRPTRAAITSPHTPPRVMGRVSSYVAGMPRLVSDPVKDAGLARHTARGIGRTFAGASAIGDVNTLLDPEKSTGEAVSSAAGLAINAGAVVRPNMLINPYLLAPTALNVGLDYMSKKYKDVPRDELIRQGVPLPPMVADIRGPATMDYVNKRLKERLGAANFFSPQGIAPNQAAEEPRGQQNGQVDAEAVKNVFKPLRRAVSMGDKMVSIPQLGSAAQPPNKRNLGPLPTLQAGQNQSIFSALMNLGGDMNQYHQGAMENRRAQTDFENALRAGEFNINTLSKSMNIKTQLDDNERRNLESDMKQRVYQATQLLASGNYPKESERGLRMIAGLEKGKYTPAVIYGDPDSNGIQRKVSVAVRDDGTVIPLSVPGMGPGNNKIIARNDFLHFVSANGISEKQAKVFFESRGFAVEEEQK